MAEQTKVKLFWDMGNDTQLMAPLLREGWRIVAFVCDDDAGWVAYLQK